MAESMMAGRQGEPLPALLRLCDLTVVPFAGATLLANITVALGGGLDTLIAATVVCGLGAVGFAIWQRRSRAYGDPGDTPTTSAPERDVDERTRNALLLGSAIAVAVYLATDSFAAFSACGLMLAVGALARTWRAAPSAREGVAPAGATAVLIVLSIACAVATAVAHRSDADDSFYVNLVVAAVDRPDAPLLAGDTLHGIDDVPMSLPVFRVLSWEILQAGLARVTGIDALTLVQVVIPPLIALLIPLAYARLLSLLLPGRWLFALGVVIVGLLWVGDGQAGYADFALLRLHQGKSVLLHVALPLISAYGIEFALHPDRRRFVHLMSAQIAAVGLSSSGLWLAPTVSMLAILGAMPWPVRREQVSRSAKTLALGLATSAHALGLALALRAETQRAFEQAVHPLASLGWSGEQLIAHAAELVLGVGPWAPFVLFCLPAALAAAPGLLMRRFTAVSLAFFFCVLWNPLTAPLIAHHVTGTDTYFRIFWVIPLPILVATVLTTPLEWPVGKLGATRTTRVAATLVLIAAAFLALPETRTFSADNEVRIARPGWKVDPEELEIVRQVADQADSGDIVLAPVWISRWLPLLHDHPAPLMVREMHLGRLHDRLGAEELERRLVLTHLVGGERFGPAGARLLAQAIDDYPLEVVCLAGPGLARADLRRVLIDSALEVRARGPEYEIWARGTMRR